MIIKDKRKMKTLIKVVFSVVFAVVVGYSLYTSHSTNALPNLVLVNAEALALDEGGSTYMGTAAKCESTEVVETYEATGGYTWSVELKAWLVNGKVTKTPPPSYEKKTTTKKSTWDGCKNFGNQACDAPPC